MIGKCTIPAAFFSTIIMSIILCSSALATRFEGGQSVYIVDTVTINDDLFAGGQNVDVNGHIRGDLIISGMSGTLDGEVDGSVMAFVYHFKMSGHCRNSVRAFARRIDVDGHIERNLMVFGEEVILGEQGWVEKDVHVGANKILIQGRIGGKLEGGGGEVYISGQIDEDVRIEARSVVIQPTAIIGGNLTTVGEKEPKIEPGAQILGLTSHSLPQKKEGGGYSFGDFLGDRWSFLALALIGGILLALFRGFTREVTGYIQTHLLKSLGLGFVFFVCLPIAALISVITLVGIPVGLTVLAGWLLLFYLSKVFAAIIIGEWTFRRLRRGRMPGLFWSLLVGLVIIILVLKIPYVWLVVKLAIIFLAFGGFFSAAAHRYAQTPRTSETA